MTYTQNGVFFDPQTHEIYGTVDSARIKADGKLYVLLRINDGSTAWVIVDKPHTTRMLADQLAGAWDKCVDFIADRVGYSWKDTYHSLNPYRRG